MNRWKYFVAAMVAALTLTAHAEQAERANLDFSGYYSSDANNTSASRATNHNVYIKLFEDRWIATLYIPFPYAASLDEQTIDSVLENARSKVTTSSYLRGKFGHLEELSTVQIERFGYLDDRIVFECSKLAPCTLKPGDGYVEVFRPGMINEHIIRYNHVPQP